MATGEKTTSGQTWAQFDAAWAGRHLRQSGVRSVDENFLRGSNKGHGVGRVLDEPTRWDSCWRQAKVIRHRLGDSGGEEHDQASSLIRHRGWGSFSIDLAGFLWRQCSRPDEDRHQGWGLEAWRGQTRGRSRRVFVSESTENWWVASFLNFQVKCPRGKGCHALLCIFCTTEHIKVYTSIQCNFHMFF